MSIDEADHVTSRGRLPNKREIYLQTRFAMDLPAELGQNPTDKEFFEIVSSVDIEMKGIIDFDSFIKIVARQKRIRGTWCGNNGDLVDAYVACGGNPDETGSADASKIVKIVKTDFRLNVDIEGIIDALDVNRTGRLGFAQFKEMLSN